MTQDKTLSVDLAWFAGPVTTRWYSSTNARRIIIDSEPLPNRGSHFFRTPGDNGTKASDWVLILEAR